TTYCGRSSTPDSSRTGSTHSKSGRAYKGRKRVLSDEQIDKARARVEAGEGPSAIARDLGVGRSTLYRALQRHTP
ncbi:MAG: helix-turn-helix domain-containing protein, partial [Dietzia maris]